MTERIRHYIEAFAIALVAVLAWAMLKEPPKPVGDYERPKKDERIADLPEEVVTCTQVVVVKGGKKAVNLPPEVVDDADKQVVSAVEIQSRERRQSVVSVFDLKTGRVDTLSQELEYAAFGLENRGGVGVGIGAKDGAVVGHLYARASVIQVYGWHVGAAAHLFTDRSSAAEATIEYRW